jgi:hypothetical protein
MFQNRCKLLLWHRTESKVKFFKRLLGIFFDSFPAVKVKKRKLVG